MKHLKKYNEDMESDELGFELINMEPEEFDGEIEIGQSWDRLPDGSELKEGYDEEGREFVLIVRDGQIEVAIYEYEIMNPFVFGDIIVVPGHDTITCYNFKTGEDKTSFIR